MYKCNIARPFPGCYSASALNASASIKLAFQNKSVLNRRCAWLHSSDVPTVEGYPVDLFTQAEAVLIDCMLMGCWPTYGGTVVEMRSAGGAAGGFNLPEPIKTSRRSSNTHTHTQWIEMKCWNVSDHNHQFPIFLSQLDCCCNGATVFCWTSKLVKLLTCLYQNTWTIITISDLTAASPALVCAVTLMQQHTWSIVFYYSYVIQNKRFKHWRSSSVSVIQWVASKPLYQKKAMIL